MVSGLADPTASQAVLVAVTGYRRMPALPATANNVATLADLLTTSDLWGLPPDNCHVVLNPPSSQVVLDALHQACAARKLDSTQ